ncbi:MAG: DNA polymerase ligase N-terminal domain-containing protein [Candidatus Nanoarchaeia archaeon]
MTLKEYKKKRDFSKIDEPKQAGKGKHVFVIQKHKASRLHYDFRLSIGGVLKSWAIPKQPVKRAGVKRLAVETEDHPMNYKDFEGIIPEGQYGAGKVEIWDKGRYEHLQSESMKQAYKKGKMVFRLEGKRLKGDYALIKTKDKNWLFFKKKHD